MVDNPSGTGFSPAGPDSDADRSELDIVSATDATIAAVLAAVPGYRQTFTGWRGEEMRRQVQLTLRTFREASRAGGPNGYASAPLRPAVDAAFQMGRREAQLGGSTESLLTAYRVGGRVAWKRLSGSAADRGMTGAQMAEFAQFLFDYVDQLSAASVAGFEHEVAASAGVVERARESLARALLEGLDPEAAERRARLARWAIPQTVTVILIHERDIGSVLGRLPTATLVVSDDLPGAVTDDVTALLVPDLSERGREQLVCSQVAGVMGPRRETPDAATSYRWALRLWEHRPTSSSEPMVNADAHLVDVVLAADPEALEELRHRCLAPLDDLPDQQVERLKETLQAWLLYRGRRDLVAKALYVHPQTVRYRLSQLRRAFGEELDDPTSTLRLLVSLR